MVIVNCNVCAHPIYGKWTMQSHMLEFGKSNLRWPRKCNETRWREYWKSKKLREMGICRDKRPSLAHNTHTFLGVQCVFMALNHLPPPHAGHNVHFICTIWSFFYVFDFFFLLCVVCWLVPAVRHCWRCTASFVFLWDWWCGHFVESFRRAIKMVIGHVGQTSERWQNDRYKSFCLQWIYPPTCIGGCQMMAHKKIVYDAVHHLSLTSCFPDKLCAHNFSLTN